MAAPVRAMVLTKPKTLEPRELPRPAIGADDGLLRLEACGICGSDYEQYDGTLPVPYPVIPGHEPVGISQAQHRRSPGLLQRQGRRPQARRATRQDPRDRPSGIR